jgi:hypothetical protein
MSVIMVGAPPEYDTLTEPFGGRVTVKDVPVGMAAFARTMLERSTCVTVPPWIYTVSGDGPAV